MGGGAEARREWGAMGSARRAAYKGGTDAERFRRFALDRVMAEARTRDWRWLYTGKEPAVKIGLGAEPDSHELKTATILSQNGFEVVFKQRSLFMKDRRADATIGGRPFEFKNPGGNGYLTIYNQVKSNLYGEGKHSINPQSTHLVISNVRSEMTMEKMVGDIRKMIDKEEGFVLDGFDLMEGFVVVDKSGYRTKSVSG